MLETYSLNCKKNDDRRTCAFYKNVYLENILYNDSVCVCVCVYVMGACIKVKLVTYS